VPSDHFPFFARLKGCFRRPWLAAVWTALGILFWTSPLWGKDADFLIQSWQDREGLPESTALAVAQTPDG